MIDVSHNYVTLVVSGDIGNRAMKLVSKVAMDVPNSKMEDLSPICYLKGDTELSDGTSVCIGSGEPFRTVIFFYVVDRYSVLNSNEAPRERATRHSRKFTMANAKDATCQYIDFLWEVVQQRLPYTGLSNSPCTFSEALAEGIFGIF